MHKVFMHGIWPAALLCLAAAAGADEFVGTEVCRGCHEQAFRGWQGSHHDLAMQHASDDTVLGDFDGTTFTHGGVESRFFRRDGAFFVRTDGADGKLAEFAVSYTFGVEPLQQYLVEFPDGRLQALGIAWDDRAQSEGGQRWFHLYPGEDVDHRHDLHWTGRQQNWNYMCATCHSTNLRKGYDVETDRFDTTWTDIDVGCEACHGPGSTHVAWARTGAKDDGSGHGLGPALAGGRVTPWPADPETGSARPWPDQTPAPEVEVCADCHARRAELAEAGETDRRFANHFMPALLTEGLYHADGQIDDEVFVWGSFTQSRMHQAGVTCSNCHEPHSLELRAPGNGVCSQCHAPAQFDTPEHHHHPADAAGSACVDCHMPETTYMVVDPRRDHSLRIPRPDVSVAFGTPNACNDCHHDETADWAARHYRSWYPDSPGGVQTWTHAFSAARAGNPAAEPLLVGVIEDSSVPDIARATAVRELQPFLSPASGATLARALKDPDPLVRIAALGSLEAAAPAQRYGLAGHLLADELLAVRIEAARVLAGVPTDQLSSADRPLLRQATADYVAAQKLHADRPEAHVNLGSLYRARGELDRAASAYRQAIRLDPAFVPGYANLADAMRLTGGEEMARSVLRQGLEQVPDAAALHHALGLVEVRAGNREAGVGSLGQAMALDPDNARFSYVYAVALHSMGDFLGAVRVLRTNLAHHPYDRDTLLALATMHRDAGQLDTALEYAQLMLEVRPADPGAAALAEALQRQRD